MRKIYTRRNPDPNAPIIVDNLERILRSIGGSSSKSGIPSHSRVFSSDIILSPEDKQFDDKIEEVLFSSKTKN